MTFPEAALRAPSPEDLKRMMEAFYTEPPAHLRASGKEGRIEVLEYKTE